MSDYLSTLSQTQKDNMAYLIKRMNEKGITNKYAQAAILSVVSKESSFIPRSEVSYSTTDNARIRSIFGSRLAKYNDAELTALKKDDKKFFDAVYGGMYGNAPDEGYKYRGRGFNQITFKGNYAALAKKIGIDIVKDPDALARVPAATDALLQYYFDRFNSAPKEILKYYNTTGINDFKNLKDSLGAIYHANAGWGKSLDQIRADVTGGKAKAESRLDAFYKVVETTKEIVKKNWIPIALVTISLTGLIIVLVTKK